MKYIDPMEKIKKLVYIMFINIMIATTLVGSVLFIKTLYSEVESKAEYTLIEKSKSKGAFGKYDYDFIVKDASGKKKHISVTKEDYLLVKKGDKVDGDGDLIQ